MRTQWRIKNRGHTSKDGDKPTEASLANQRPRNSVASATIVVSRVTRPQIAQKRRKAIPGRQNSMAIAIIAARKGIRKRTVGTRPKTKISVLRIGNQK